MDDLGIRHRIESVIKSEQISSAKFADILGVQRSNISHILSGRNNPSLEFIIRMTEKFDYINLEWLVFGIGEMMKSSEVKKDRQNVTSSNLFTGGQSSNSVIAPVKLDERKEIIEPKEKHVTKIVVFYSDNSFEEFKTA